MQRQVSYKMFLNRKRGQRCAFKQTMNEKKFFFAERPKSVSPEFSGLNEAQADASSHLMRDMAAGFAFFRIGRALNLNRASLSNFV